MDFHDIGVVLAPPLGRLSELGLFLKYRKPSIFDLLFDPVNTFLNLLFLLKMPLHLRLQLL